MVASLPTSILSDGHLYVSLGPLSADEVDLQFELVSQDDGHRQDHGESKQLRVRVVDMPTISTRYVETLSSGPAEAT